MPPRRRRTGSAGPFSRALGDDSQLTSLTNDVSDRFILAEKQRGLAARGIKAELRVLEAAPRWVAHPQRGRMIAAVSCRIEPLRFERPTASSAISRVSAFMISCRRAPLAAEGVWELVQHVR